MTENFIAITDRIQLEAKDLYAIDKLAQETSHPAEEVRKIYADVLGRLRPGARIQDYLIVLTSKKVRDMLKTRKPEVNLRPQA